MTTPNETRTPRPSFWLRAIEHRKHEMTREYRKSLGTNARDGVSDEDYATTMATLEKMARNLGWDESQRHEGKGAGRRHFGRMHGHGHGFGPGHHFPHENPRAHEEHPSHENPLPRENPEA